MNISFADVEKLAWDKCDGLLPAVVQHAGSGAVLMLGYMNREALRATLERQRVVFFSRSKRRLWEKGETSGHFLQLRAVAADCDLDTCWSAPCPWARSVIPESPPASAMPHAAPPSSWPSCRSCRRSSRRASAIRPKAAIPRACTPPA